MQLQSSFKVTVVVAGTDTHHDLYGAAGALAGLVAEAGLPVQIAVGLDRFVDPMPVTRETDVFVIYTAGSNLSAAEQSALVDLVAGGKGVVALHSSSVVLADQQQTFSDLIGARYLGHCPDASEGRIAVRVGDHPITVLLPDFEIDDEYYRLETGPGVEVIAEHRLTDGSWAPAMIIRTEGAGRVVYTTLGHDGRAWSHPRFRQLVRQAVLWAGGLDPSAPGVVQSWSTRFPLGNGGSIGPSTAGWPEPATDDTGPEGDR